MRELKYKLKDALDLDMEDTSWPMGSLIDERKVARAIVINGTKLMFVHVDRNDDFGNVRYIETSGGGVEEGEDTIVALKRELKEELGVRVEVLAYLGQIRDYYNLIGRKNNNDYYLAKVIGREANNLTEDEKNKWHLTPCEMSFESAVKKYSEMKLTRLGKLVSQRELPVLIRAKELIDQESLMGE